MWVRRAAIPGRVGGTSVIADPDARLGAPVARNVIDIEAAGLGVVLPAGGLVRGSSVVGCVGSRSVVAGVTRAGEWAAVVDAAQLGLLMVAEVGGHPIFFAVSRSPGWPAVLITLARNSALPAMASTGLDRDCPRVSRTGAGGERWCGAAAWRGGREVVVPE